MNNQPTSAFVPVTPRSTNNSPESVGAYSVYLPSPLSSASSTPTFPSSNPPGYQDIEPELDRWGSFPSTAAFFVRGLISPEGVYRGRHDILGRIASKLIILLRKVSQRKPNITYASFLNCYQSVLQILSDYPIFLFQKLNFTVEPFQHLHQCQQDRARIRRHLEILKEDFGGNPTAYYQVNRIRIRSGTILWSQYEQTHTVHFIHKDLPDLIL